MKIGSSPSWSAEPSIGFQRMDAAIGIGRSSAPASTSSAPPGARNRTTLPCTPVFTRFHMRLPDGLVHRSGNTAPRSPRQPFRRERLHHPVPELERIVETLNAEPLITTMRPHV